MVRLEETWPVDVVAQRDVVDEGELRVCTVEQGGTRGRVVVAGRVEDAVESRRAIRLGERVYQRSDGGGNLLVTAIRNADIRLRVYDRKTSKILGSAEDEAATQRSGLPQLQRDTFQWHGPDTFLVEAADDTGTPAADGCSLTVQFTERAATVLQQGGCNGARLEGTYLRDLSDLPSNHESSVD